MLRFFIKDTVIVYVKFCGKSQILRTKNKCLFEQNFLDTNSESTQCHSTFVIDLCSLQQFALFVSGVSLEMEYQQ